MTIIRANGLTFTYSGQLRPAIEEVHLSIEEGEFVLIAGPSGCGKTTLCRCLNGLIPHFYEGELKGDIFVTGLNVKDHSIRELARYVGMVFQNPENQLFALSVEKDVAFGLENLGLPRSEMMELIEWAMKAVGVYELRDKAPYELSGGQKQRVAIACVLAMKPKVLVLDEPTSSLDPFGARQVLEVVRKLNEELNMTVVLVEHRLDLAVKYATRAIVMNDGRIVLDGDPRDVLSSKEAISIGIDVPKVVKLYRALQEVGLTLSEVPIAAEEMVQLLQEVLKR